jgi:hypothetical protein
VRSLSFRPATLAIRLGCDLDPQSREAGMICSASY